MSILIQQYRTALRAAAAPFVGALDAYTSNLWAARWTKRLLASYSGALIRVRRSSDNAEADIGYESDGSLDDAAVLAHCGASIGYVTTMYDQSGNSRNLTQAITTLQPSICASGAMLGTVGEHYGVYYSDTVSIRYLVDSNPSALTSIELFSAVKNDGDPMAEIRTGHPFCYQTAQGATSSLYPYSDGNIYDKFASTARKFAGNPSNSMILAHMYNCLSSASDWRLYAGGHTYTTASNTVEITTAPRVGSGASVTEASYSSYNGYVAGCVIYSAAQSSRATIRGLLLSGSG